MDIYKQKIYKVIFITLFLFITLIYIKLINLLSILLLFAKTISVEERFIKRTHLRYFISENNLNPDDFGI
ncbi:MAG: hypothetical protein A2W91_02130 [Bacteroidetes bacterium GWF2_38_335]|nr:MAG: hypothetical protein A2W91_02130 [Bacteroidetes bacterium GWF2_38_335]OFY80651.1 MAG: hypothetical protein A2281_05145 [Bacteroidetes bacterium RIFOXYA12_FULL_38_20]HBS86992.1 hypothetical protein [Bacteroidales bacterium]